MYYQTNALYNFLEEHPDDRFFFVASDMWMLTYGNSDCDPLLLVLVSGVHETVITNAITVKERSAIEMLNSISIASNVPLIFIRFSIDLESIDSIMVYDAQAINFQRKSLDELKATFSRYGLPIKNAPTAKYLNDKLSSAYHNWQRHQLGSSLKVSDIDLINIKDGALFAFYELKRSYKSLEIWQPYRDDYPNFILLSRLASRAGLRFRIAYNVRTKNPWNDDISRIKVFGFNHVGQNKVRDLAIYTLENFLNL